MRQSDISAHVAAETSLSRADAAGAVDAVLSIISDTLAAESRSASRASGAGPAGELDLSSCLPDERGTRVGQPRPARRPPSQSHGGLTAGSLAGNRRSDRIVSSYPSQVARMIDSNG